ncbi:MAG: hypothetical protein ACE5Q6_26650, partial [Dehalococcoidia bacterium]
MNIFQNLRNDSRFWLCLVYALVMAIALGRPSNAGSVGAGAQSVQDQGTVYVTMQAGAPNGTILKLED